MCVNFSSALFGSVLSIRIEYLHFVHGTDAYGDKEQLFINCKIMTLILLKSQMKFPQFSSFLLNLFVCVCMHICACVCAVWVSQSSTRGYSAHGSRGSEDDIGEGVCSRPSTMFCLKD